MQPMLVISAPVAGVLYWNGRFAGECAPDAAVVLPVAPRGAHYLEYRPLTSGARALARRLVFASGRPVGVPEDVFCVCWPGGAVEAEIACEEAPRTCFRGAPLPPGAREPEVTPLEDGALLLGEIDEGRYAATADAAGSLNGFVRFSRLRRADAGNLECVTDRGDTVGHALLETWRATGAGLRLLASESAWTHGAPRWPQSAEDTALAAFEAALLGLDGEADGYLAPELRGRGLPGALAAGATSCGRMRYAPPDAANAVALFVRAEERLALARGVFFRCVPAGGPQGPWQIAALWTEDASDGRAATPRDARAIGENFD